MEHQGTKNEDIEPERRINILNMALSLTYLGHLVSVFFIFIVL